MSQDLAHIAHEHSRRGRAEADGGSLTARRVARSGLSHRHQAIAEHLIANPDKPLRQIAPLFGYSETYFYMLVGSNAFQDYYHALLGHNLDTRVMPLRDKVNGVAHSALDRLGKALEEPDLSPEFYLDVANKLLQRGLATGTPQAPAGPQGPALTQINNYYSSDSERLARARERMQAFYEHVEAGARAESPGQDPGAEPVASSTPELPSTPYGDLGADVHRAAPVDEAPAPGPWCESSRALLRTEDPDVARTDVRAPLPSFALD